MKRTIKTIAVTLLFPLGLFAAGEELTFAPDSAKKDTSWKFSGLFSVNLNQVSLTNWAAGGKSSVSLGTMLNYNANYKKGKHVWDNSIDLAYGRLWQDGDDTKTDDRIELNSKYGYEIAKNWYASYLMNFRTQFDVGYDATFDTLKISEFMSPGYLVTGPGIDYKPNDNFSVFISPVEMKATFVMDQSLADVGQFGVDAAEYDDMGNKTKDGENVRIEVGAYLKMIYTRELMKNTNFTTKLDLFADYIDDPSHIDVNWEVLLTLKVNDWLACTLNTLLIYDHDVKIIQETDNGATKVGPVTQFKQTFGAGLSVKL